MSEKTKELLIDLQQYIDEPNNQDINGEYYPPRELEQGEAKLLLDLITNLQNQLQQKDNIIKAIKAQLDYLETYSSKEDVYEDMKRRLDRIEKIIGGSNE